MSNDENIDITWIILWIILHGSKILRKNVNIKNLFHHKYCIITWLPHMKQRDSRTKLLQKSKFYGIFKII